MSNETEENQVDTLPPPPPPPQKKKDDEEAVVDAAPAPAAIKKKRSAGNQLTKDDYDAGEGDCEVDGDEIIKQGFKRAPEDVLKGRKIYKINRTAFQSKTPATAASGTGTSVAATTNGTTTTASSTTTTDNKNDDTTITTDNDKDKKSATTAGQSNANTSSNPFAATTLVAKKISEDANEEEKKKKNPFASTFLSTAKKVFGFGSGGGGGGFGSTTTAAAAAAAAASTSSSSMVVAGAEGSNMTKVSGGFGGVGGGFGSIGSTSSNTSTGFGSATGNEKGWFEGGSVSSNNGGSPFGGGATSSTIQFNFSSNNNNNAAGENGAAAAAAGQLLELPDNVELTTGEEEEKVIHEGRCKSFIWVLDDKDETKDGSAGGHDDVTDAAGKANPSVKPSTEFHAAITNITKSEDSSSNNATDKEDDSDDKKDKDDTTKTENGVAETAATEQKQPEHRWQELGIGPMKILRSTIQPDRLRLVQRRESSKMGKATKVILNVPLWKESTCERDRQAQQYLRLKTFKNGKVCSYSLKFKESTDAGYFHHYITDHIPHARECFSK